MPKQLANVNFIQLKVNKVYELTFNKLKTVLLPAPYITNCRHYDLNGEQDFRFRYDCVNYCFNERMNKECWILSKELGQNETKINSESLFRLVILWRKDLLENKGMDKLRLSMNLNDLAEYLSVDIENEQDAKNKTLGMLANCVFDNMHRFYHECEDNCQTECVNRFYNYQLQLTKDNEDSTMSTKITITHSQMPDQTTEHLVQMSFSAFSGALGGLLGMWLGLSAVAILHYLIKVV